MWLPVLPYCYGLLRFVEVVEYRYVHLRGMWRSGNAAGQVGAWKLLCTQQLLQRRFEGMAAEGGRACMEIRVVCGLVGS